ncbi:unnamed protein product [Ceratitis capitata]|uniref:(Mediterranean fruit fly) hypothetical protein n=1 Tax=Ceratitis capitata TaxID=7213 RepID=A0A811V0U6_CERCA|nr:unnamed protein product [Ceratitis capitata]
MEKSMTRKSCLKTDGNTNTAYTTNRVTNAAKTERKGERDDGAVRCKRESGASGGGVENKVIYADIGEHAYGQTRKLCIEGLMGEKPERIDRQSMAQHNRRILFNAGNVELWQSSVEWRVASCKQNGIATTTTTTTTTATTKTTVATALPYCLKRSKSVGWLVGNSYLHRAGDVNGPSSIQPEKYSES